MVWPFRWRWGGGIASLTWLGLSAAGWVTPSVAWGLWFLALVCLHKQIRSGMAQVEVIKDYWIFAGKFERFFLIAAAILAVNQVWTALAPPLKYDALTYHLAIPQQTVISGALVYPPANPYWGHPQVAEMLFTWATALGRVETAALTGWLFALTALIGIAGFSARWLPAESDARRISAAIRDVPGCADGCGHRALDGQLGLHRSFFRSAGSGWSLLLVCRESVMKLFLSEGRGSRRSLQMTLHPK